MTRATIFSVLFLTSALTHAQLAPPMTVNLRTEPPVVQYVYMICQYAVPLGLDVGLAISLCWNESRFNAGAYNENRRKIRGRWKVLSTDAGLFQLNSMNLEQFARDYNDGQPINPYDPETNIRVGVRRFAELVKKYGKRLAVCYWNAGEWCKEIPKKSAELADRVLGGGL